MPLLLIIFLCLILFVSAVFLFLLAWSNLTTRAPFIPVPEKILPEIVKALELKKGSRLYDLGCGDARVLISCQDANSYSECIGIEKDLIPFVCAKFRLMCLGKNKSTKIKLKNFFKEDLSPATHIFVYLFPELMDDLLPKLEKELKPGTRVVSCDFYFQKRKAVKIIELNREKRELGKRLYIYEF